MSEKVPETIKKYISEVNITLKRLSIENVLRVVELLEEARLKAKRVFIFGNGGSAATASHFAADLSKGAISSGKARIKAFALSQVLEFALAIPTSRIKFLSVLTRDIPCLNQDLFVSG